MIGRSLCSDGIGWKLLGPPPVCAGFGERRQRRQTGQRHVRPAARSGFLKWTFEPLQNLTGTTIVALVVGVQELKADGDDVGGGPDFCSVPLRKRIVGVHVFWTLGARNDTCAHRPLSAPHVLSTFTHRTAYTRIHVGLSAQLQRTCTSLVYQNCETVSCALTFLPMTKAFLEMFP